MSSFIVLHHILFNFIVSFYSKSQAEKDLQTAVSTIAEEIESGDLKKVISLTRTQSHATSAELIIYNKRGELSKIYNNTSSFITNEISKLAYDKVQTLNEKEIGSFSYDGDKYYVVGIGYEGQAMTNKIVYISKGLIIDEFVYTVNIVLLIVSTIIMLIAIVVSKRVTNSIAKPIEHLTSLVGNMKSDELIVINDRSNSLELHKLTNEINLLNKRIYNYNKSQKSFLHNASHELRTPLMSIQGYADGIEMGVFEDSKGTAHLISDQTKKLTKLVDSLLTLARAENFNANNKLERLNISDTLLEMLNSYKGYAMSNNIEIVTNIKPNVFGNANKELLTSSIGNIISNAIRYAKTTVTLTLSEKDGEFIIKVCDDGVGISDIEKIFDRFSKGNDGNFGLGLSIAKTSVNMMNGEIKAYNNGGAVFEVTLPLL